MKTTLIILLFALFTIVSVIADYQKQQTERRLLLAIVDAQHETVRLLQYNVNGCGGKVCYCIHN